MSDNTLNNEAIYDARTLGYPKMVVLGLQHTFAMFGATVLVPLLTGLNVSTTLLFAGLVHHLLFLTDMPLLHHYLTGNQTQRCFRMQQAAFFVQVFCM